VDVKKRVVVINKLCAKENAGEEIMFIHESKESFTSTPELQ